LLFIFSPLLALRREHGLVLVLGLILVLAVGRLRLLLLRDLHLYIFAGCTMHSRMCIQYTRCTRASGQGLARSIIHQAVQSGQRPARQASTPVPVSLSAIACLPD
jgi:hypothetical protein